MALSVHGEKALDVGCGSGGRVITALLDGGFEITGLDVSQAMLNMAKAHHPRARFIRADICEWEPDEQYELIVAWDDIFNVPYTEQRQVTQKLCQALACGGVILFTAGIECSAR